MEEKITMTADEVAEALQVSKTQAYNIIRQLNQELKEQGYLVMRGRVNRQYFMKKTCYGTE